MQYNDDSHVASEIPFQNTSNKNHERLHYTWYTAYIIQILGFNGAYTDAEWYVEQTLFDIDIYLALLQFKLY